MFAKKSNKRFNGKSNPQVEIKQADEMFYQAAEDWRYDMYQSQSVWLKRSLLVNAAQFLLLLLALLIFLLLMPLKQTTPFLYTFDKATGEITKIGKLEPTQLTANWEMSRYFLIQYVLNRESYDYFNIERPYQLAWAMSDPVIQKQYEGEVSSNNPHSPYKFYGKAKYITVNILDVSPLSPDTASVRFEKTLHDRNADTQQTIEKIAIVKWKYTQLETSQKMLDRDPLGFNVIYYQVSQVNLDNALTSR